MFARGRLIVLMGLSVVAVACGKSTGPMAAVTYNKTIAPILYKNCAPCHRPGEATPFSLLSYNDAIQHADDIAEQVKQRHMPPWLPESGPVAIAGERRLTSVEIDAIQRWVAQGTVEGPAEERIAPPEFPGGWQLGTPDQIVTPDRPFAPGVLTDDIYRNLVMKLSLKAGTYVRAVEFKTNGAQIHHAVIRVDSSPGSRRRDGQDGKPGFDGMTSWPNVYDPDGHFIGWAPGRGPIVLPEGMPWRLDRGTDLVVELHLIPTKTPSPIQPTIGLYFTSTPPVRYPVAGKLSSRVIDIPAGDPAYVVTDSMVLPVATQLLSVYPHAHYLAKQMLGTATLPDGSTKTLIDIRQWSFHWQQDYRFVTPLDLPAGTRVSMRYTYDNSAANPHNPTKPPVRVQTGPRSKDEMAELGMTLVAATQTDSPALVRAIDAHEAEIVIAAAEGNARREPGNAQLQAALGAAYLDAGRSADAIAPLETALRINEGLAGAHSDLGTALLALQRPSDALTHLRRAVALAPKNAVMLFNLGNALVDSGQNNEGAAAFERSIVLDDTFADPHVNLAAMQLQRGMIKPALAHLQRAAELVPDSASIQNSYGRALAAAGRFPEAMQHVRRAIELVPTFGPALDTLRQLQQMGIK